MSVDQAKYVFENFARLSRLVEPTQVGSLYDFVRLANVSNSITEWHLLFAFLVLCIRYSSSRRCLLFYRSLLCTRFKQVLVCVYAAFTRFHTRRFDMYMFCFCIEKEIQRFPCCMLRQSVPPLGAFSTPATMDSRKKEDKGSFPSNCCFSAGVS